MTRKDYRLIAQALRLVDDWDDWDVIRLDVINQLSIVFKQDNPNFKREKFEAAVFGK